MIYVLRVQNRKNGFFKVGTSINPARRIPDIQTNCPFKISVVALRHGGQKEERALHKLLKDYRTNGEWFEDTKETREILKINTVYQDLKKSYASQADWFKVIVFLESNKEYSYDAEMLCNCLGLNIEMLRKFYHNKKFDSPFRIEGVSKDDAVKINLVGELGSDGLVISHPDLFTPILGAYDSFWQKIIEFPLTF